MGELFDVKQATISEHINNILTLGELDETSIGFSDKSSGGRKPKIYNLDMILKAVNLYTEALVLLDQYDHQSLIKHSGRKPAYRITYDDCRKMIDHMEDSFGSDVFGVEKEKWKSRGNFSSGISRCFWRRGLPIARRKSCKSLIFYDKGSSIC